MRLVSTGLMLGGENSIGKFRIVFGLWLWWFGNHSGYIKRHRWRLSDSRLVIGVIFRILAHGLRGAFNGPQDQTTNGVIS